LERKKRPYSILTADVINHKSQGRWNCCTGWEISAILPKPLHLLFYNTAKQTKTGIQVQFSCLCLYIYSAFNVFCFSYYLD